MLRQKRFLLLLAFAGICLRAFSLELGDLIGSEEAAALLAGEKPVLAQFKDPEPRLLPRFAFLRELTDAHRAELDPSTLVETLRLYKKPLGAEQSAWSAAEEAALYNSLLELSTLQGLQYFSASRGVMRLFYELSVVIDGPEDKRPLPDPVFFVPQEELTLYARQKDLTFGDNIYQYDYYFTPGGFIFVQKNLTPLRAGIIPAVGRENLRSILAVLDAGDSVLVYAASMAKTVSIPGMNTRVGNSFTNRAEAIVNWFSAQADKTYARVRR